MAITNFIPTVWGEALHQTMNRQLIGVSNCTREYEGDITEKGSVVKICGLQNVAIRDYVKNTDMELPESLTDFSTELKIDHAKYFNFQIDDVDRAQATPHLMELAMQNAASRLASEADRAVFKLYDQATLKAEIHYAEACEILKKLVEARTKLYENGVTNNDDVVIEVTPKIASLILKQKLDLVPNTDTLENGCIGSLFGCKIYVSNNIESGYWYEVNADMIVHKCIMRTKRAVAFASQLSEIQAYRPELRFADAVKGLYLFGCKIVRPEEFVKLECVCDPTYVD